MLKVETDIVTCITVRLILIILLLLYIIYYIYILYKVYQLLAHGRWFSPGTPASSTTKTGRHDIAEILLKVALTTINQIYIPGHHSVLLPVFLFLDYFICRGSIDGQQQ